MNQRLVKSVAHIISAMSDEERQLLEAEVQAAEDPSQANGSVEEDKSVRVAEVAEDIKVFEEKYSVSQSVNHQPYDENERSVVAAETTGDEAGDEAAAYSFFRVASSLNLDGPKDWSVNIDHYLYDAGAGD
ncbi:MAG: hypothetical protein WBB01_08705 [Phormidesmis sp.]